MTPLEKVAAAIQEFVTDVHGPVLVDGLVLVYEVVRLADDGEAIRCVDYAVPGDHAAMSGAVGLLHLGAAMVARDILAFDDDDD